MNMKKNLCKHGIQYQSIVPYNSQQDYVIEIMNITILNIVRSMRFLKNITLMIGDDVISCAFYVKYLCASHTLRERLLIKCGMDEILR